ncbi:hypothetical protein [Roseobacter litoralis]|uniref:hypothetical protein n=1 Tax=Roseobacter litoralis TaxID=42443 RepID=UPI002494FC3E|nr:hypothetical protein [Roseobacter litoralis]
MSRPEPEQPSCLAFSSDGVGSQWRTALSGDYRFLIGQLAVEYARFTTPQGAARYPRDSG